MFEFVNKILSGFRSCFSRQAAFAWFVVIVTGFLIRSDSLGVTSVIRDLSLNPALYGSMLHFFRADSWDWPSLFSTWAETAAALAPLQRVSERAVLIGDGVKRASDGRFMPCTKKMVQESESARKPRFIHGHFFGAVGVLAGTAAKSFCLPLSVQLHDGDEAVSDWLGEEHVSHVVQMFRDGCRAARYFGRSLFVLDRYFLTVPLLLEWSAYEKEHPGMLSIVTRAKRNCTAYEQPEPYKGRGRRPVHGRAVHLQELFESSAASFQQARLQVYGCEKEVRFLSKICLWGQKLYQPVHFVLVEYDRKQIILAGTDLSMAPEDIIRAYAYRFKIEAMFREMKQQMGAFFYHFWTKATPRLERYSRKGSPDPLEKVTGREERERILSAVKATEGYLLLCCIATGILQMLCLNWEGKIRVSGFRYLRTPSCPVMSEASMMEYLRRNLFRFMAKSPELTITKIISDKQILLEHEEIGLFIN